MDSKTQGIDEEFQVFLDRIYPGANYELLSDGNNLVVKVNVDGQFFVAKKIVDVDIPIDYTNTISQIISKSIPTQEVIRVFRQADGAPFDCVISRYINGRDLAEIVESEGNMPSDEELTHFLIKYMKACSDLPRLLPSFGLYKTGAKYFASHSEFLQSYSYKYWQRVRDLIIDKSVRRWVEDWIESGLAPALAGSEYRTVAIDSNLKNFIVQPNGSLSMINVPIVGWSNRAHAVACISVHYRNHPFRTTFLNVATEGFMSEEISAIDHLEAWYLLGILSFYAVKNTGDPNRWRNWGTSVPLLRDFSELVSKLGTHVP